MKKLSFCLLLILTIFPVAIVQAEACTYNEALIALEKGNLMRGLALMKMAANDGDRRAMNYFVANRASNKEANLTPGVAASVQLMAHHIPKP